MDIYAIIDRAIITYHLNQIRKEIEELSRFLIKENVCNIVEIGMGKGGTAFIWSQIAKGIKVFIDLPDIFPHGMTRSGCARRNLMLKQGAYNVKTILGNSHDQSTFEKLVRYLNGELVDFLFIDGDHVYESVKQDYLMYQQIVRKGGWIGFHDINPTPSTECEVDRLWKELSGKKLEFNVKCNAYGIGLIQH